MSDLQTRYDFATTLITRAGELAKSYAKGRSALEIASKGAQDVVTNADRNVEVLIRNALREAFPEDRFFGEESGPEEFDET